MKSINLCRLVAAIAALTLGLVVRAHAACLAPASEDDATKLSWCSSCNELVAAHWQCGGESDPCTDCAVPDAVIGIYPCHWTCPICGAQVTPADDDVHPEGPDPYAEPPVDPDLPLMPDGPTQYDIN